MLENRSFDHMLGFLYSDSGNKAPSGSAFDGLTGTESNPDSTGKAVPVYKINPRPATPTSCRAPIRAKATPPPIRSSSTPPPRRCRRRDQQGFVTDYAYTLGWQSKESGWSILPGTVATDIMGMFTPAMLPVLSGLARGFAVCDQWFSSAPTETLPNRAFACAGTSQGHMDDKTKTYTAPSIFGATHEKKPRLAHLRVQRRAAHPD